MLDDAKPHIRTAPLLPTTTTLGPVHIAVVDRDKALTIWRDVVGLEVVHETATRIDLGVGKDTMIILHPGADQPVVPKTIGLYHVAIHVPTRVDLARFAVRAIEAGVRIAPTDHLVSEAIYLWDHDGTGIEMTFETPWRGTLAEPESGAYGITNDGQPHSGREPIDLDGLLKEIEADSDPRAPLPLGTRVGHVHLHVTNLDEAMHFYRDVIGFGGLFILRDWGMGDVGLDYVPHTIAFNIWAGKNAELPPENAAGLRHFTLNVPDQQTFEALRQRLAKANAPTTETASALATRDPFGNQLHIAVVNGQG